MRTLFVAFILMFTGTLSAQVAQDALGLRFSGDDDGDGVGVEISWQHGFNDNNRLELDLGFRNNRWVDVVKLTGVYQWVFPIEKDFYWYVGPSGGLGIVDYDRDWPYYRDNYTNVYLAIGGDIGIEYGFNEVPIQLALDLRPEVFIAGDFYDNFDVDLGFAVRYQF